MRLFHCAVLFQWKSGWGHFTWLCAFYLLNVILKLFYRFYLIQIKFCKICHIAIGFHFWPFRIILKTMTVPQKANVTKSIGKPDVPWNEIILGNTCRSLHNTFSQVELTAFRASPYKGVAPWWSFSLSPCPPQPHSRSIPWPLGLKNISRIIPLLPPCPRFRGLYGF